MKISEKNMKEQYIDLIEKAFGAYSDEQMIPFIEKIKKEGLSGHGFTRLTSNLGILIAHGRKRNLISQFIDMMDLCCREIPVCLAKTGQVVGNEFSVKEIIFSLMEIEKSKVLDKEITDRWRNELAKIVPKETYCVISPVPPERIYNWAAFGAASEQVRKYAKIGCEDAFIENQIKSQILSFDSNGMYRDPSEPMVYDLVARLQLAVVLYFGYDGESRESLVENMIKSADLTLKMQSVSGEIPYGGRSNQFLHNEAHYIALCEFYATLFYKKGDIDRAASFKNAAKKALDNLILWLSDDVIHHVKNYYDINSLYGCEEYAYFNVYMITVGSWLYLAYIFSQDISIDSENIQLSDNYISETSDYFHKIFAKFNDYFIEIDSDADIHYDGTGLGRVHKYGAPSTICLSTPFAREPHYSIDIENPTNYSITGGTESEGEFIYGFNVGVKCKKTESLLTKDFALVKLEYSKDNNVLFYQTVIVSNDGVEVIVEGENKLEITFPVFCYDGSTDTKICINKNSVKVNYIEDKKIIIANRNGHYNAFSVCGKNRISLKITID